MAGESKRDESEDLSVPERIIHVQDLWDEIARASGNVELTPEQRDEAERRLSRHEGDPGEYRRWEELKRRLEAER